MVLPPGILITALYLIRFRLESLLAAPGVNISLYGMRCCAEAFPGFTGTLLSTGEGKGAWPGAAQQGIGDFMKI